MTGEELEIKLKSGTYEFYGETINSNLNISNYIIKNLSYIKFNNCCFENLLFIEGINENMNMIFHNCTFEEDINVKRCKFHKLQFSFIKNIENLNIDFGTFNELNIDSDKKPLIGNIRIEKCSIKDFNCSNLYIKKGQFSFSTRPIKENDISINLCFNDSTFEKANFSSCLFGNETDFTNFKIIKTCYFTVCHFKKVYFKNSNFGENTTFHDCKFHSYSGFEECKNLEKTNLKISSCLFKSFPHFNKSKFNFLEIIHTTFERKVSFDNVEVNSIKLYQVSFSEITFFDDFKINNIFDCDRRTIRIIKRELINSHNQIDYLRFKAYELDIYKHEKNKNWKDSFILFFNEQSNYFGLDWFKGIKFTIFTSFIFYLLYLITFTISIQSITFLPNSIEDFFVKYLKFVNPLSFLKPPIDEAENYFFPVFFLILGKIFVSYGIYQTIQAFRKFGVNGD